MNIPHTADKDAQVRPLAITLLLTAMSADEVGLPGRRPLRTYRQIGGMRLVSNPLARGDMSR